MVRSPLPVGIEASVKLLQAMIRSTAGFLRRNKETFKVLLIIIVLAWTSGVLIRHISTTVNKDNAHCQQLYGEGWDHGYVDGDGHEGAVCRKNTASKPVYP